MDIESLFLFIHHHTISPHRKTLQWSRITDKNNEELVRMPNVWLVTCHEVLSPTLHIRIHDHVVLLFLIIYTF